VREPAPFVFGGDRPAESAASEPAPPAPEPAAPSAAPDSAEPNQPRKTGWWSRRFAGGKG
jgi:ribonuclease E